MTHDLPAMQRAFESWFARALAPTNGRLTPLEAAIRYSALSPGKRLRPLLTLTACQAMGGAWRKALPAAAAVECVHAFSLVHDDLPCMDDDDYRRGQLTTHKKFGEALAVLAGDALLARAFEELRRIAASGVPPERVVEAMRVLARAAGGAQLIAGQALDVAAEGRKVTLATVREIHEKKTGALIAASLEIGGLVAGATPRRLTGLRSLGRDLGLAFQIHDDLLDRRSSLKRLGKRSKKDQARGKPTYPRAVGESQARSEAGRLYLRCLRTIERMGIEAWNLGHLILAMAEREA
jgi:geranylgeranyl diphosphate synthase, type II